VKPRAAIYARRSTDEHQVESLDTQLDNGRRFGLARGYELDPVQEFTDTASRVTVQRKPRKNGPAVELAAWPVGGPAAQA
jgi:DNA invertase Pin-like site-specific DNA recombinase